MRDQSEQDASANMMHQTVTLATAICFFFFIYLFIVSVEDLPVVRAGGLVENDTFTSSTAGNNQSQNALAGAAAEDNSQHNKKTKRKAAGKFSFNSCKQS